MGSRGKKYILAAILGFGVYVEFLMDVGSCGLSAGSLETCRSKLSARVSRPRLTLGVYTAWVPVSLT